jgi:hypothetical protein
MKISMINYLARVKKFLKNYFEKRLAKSQKKFMLLREGFGNMPEVRVPTLRKFL